MLGPNKGNEQKKGATAPNVDEQHRKINPLLVSFKF